MGDRCRKEGNAREYWVSRLSGALLLLGSTELLRLRITVRESEILFWLMRGKSNSEIAIILSSKKRTVEKHLQNLYPKLGVENRTSAAAMAWEILG